MKCSHIMEEPISTENSSAVEDWWLFRVLVDACEKLESAFTNTISVEIYGQLWYSYQRPVMLYDAEEFSILWSNWTTMIRYVRIAPNNCNQKDKYMYLQTWQNALMNIQVFHLAPGLLVENVPMMKTCS